MNKFLCKMTSCALAVLAAGSLAAADEAVNTFGQIKVKSESTRPDGQIAVKRAKLAEDGLGGKSQSNLPGGQVKAAKGGVESSKALDGAAAPLTAEDLDSEQQRNNDLETRKQAVKASSVKGAPKAPGVTPDDATPAVQAERLKKTLEGRPSNEGQTYDAKSDTDTGALKDKLNARQVNEGQAYDTKGEVNSDALRDKVKALKD